MPYKELDIVKKSLQNSADAWMSADEFGRSLRGFGVNLLVRDVALAVKFGCEVLLGECVYEDVDFACMRRGETIWQYHADHTYRDHPLYGFVVSPDGESLPGRGAGVELRHYNMVADTAEQRARQAGYVVLAGAADKPHGLREVAILDDDGYCWVVSQSLDKT